MTQPVIFLKSISKSFICEINGGSKGLGSEKKEEKTQPEAQTSYRTGKKADFKDLSHWLSTVQAHAMVQPSAPAVLKVNKPNKSNLKFEIRWFGV